MKQQKQTEKQKEKRKAANKRSYERASKTLTVMSYFWGSFLLAFFLQLIPAYLLTSGLEKNLWNSLVAWFRAEQGYPVILYKWLIILMLIVLIGITILSFLIKQQKKDAHPEGIDKLIQFLKNDTVSPHLELLQTKLDTVIIALQKTYNLLHVSLTIATQQGQVTLAQQSQQQIDCLEGIQSEAHGQVELLDSLRKQSQVSQKKLSNDLQGLSQLLEEMSGQLQYFLLSDQAEHEEVAQVLPPALALEGNGTVFTDPLLPTPSEATMMSAERLREK